MGAKSSFKYEKALPRRTLWKGALTFLAVCHLARSCFRERKLCAKTACEVERGESDLRKPPASAKFYAAPSLIWRACETYTSSKDSPVSLFYWNVNAETGRQIRRQQCWLIAAGVRGRRKFSLCFKTTFFSWNERICILYCIILKVSLQTLKRRSFACWNKID